jgi:hypothetical protein
MEETEVEVEKVEDVSQKGTPIGVLTGTWKVVDFKDSLVTIHPDTIASAKATFLTSFYTFTNDSVYTVRNNRIPSGDVGKWAMNKEQVGFYISFLSDQEKYKDAYQMMFLDENTMQWVKVIPELGKYAMLLKKQ